MICHNLRHPNVGDDKTWHVISKGSFISILQKSRYIREKKGEEKREYDKWQIFYFNVSTYVW